MLRLLVVREIQPSNSDVTILFENGPRSFLSASLKNYGYYLELARKSLDRRCPVGAALTDSGTITEIARADNDVPTQLLVHDKERMAVWFQGHNGIFYLRLDHPEFQRLNDVLKRSISTKGRVWFVARKPGLVIEDVVDGGTGSGAH